MRTRLFNSALLLFVIAFIAVLYQLPHGTGKIKSPLPSRSLATDPSMICDMPGMSAQDSKQLAQELDPGQDPETQGHQPNDKLCERPDPKNPDKGYKDPSKVGCKCMRNTDCQYKGNREDPGKPEDGFATKCKNYCFK